MKKHFLTLMLSALILGSSVSLAVNADADHPGTMGYDANKYEEAHFNPLKASAMPLNLNITHYHPVYDISEWQGDITLSQARKLKKETPFVIIRAQYGSEREDKTFQNNVNSISKAGLTYGVYSFSQYESPEDASYEAQTLYQRAPQAAFYVNDYEQQTVKNPNLTNQATLAWYQTMKSLAGSRKVLFYSYKSFAQTHANQAYPHYDGLWIAGYGSNPGITHVLWQYTNAYYSKALKERLDASVSSQTPDWFGSNAYFAPSKVKKSQKKAYHPRKKHKKRRKIRVIRHRRHKRHYWRTQRRHG